MEETYYGLFSLNLTFSTFREYKVKRKIISEAYNEMTPKEKVIYRMYVYTRPLLKEKTKDYIWEDLNFIGIWYNETSNTTND